MNKIYCLMLAIILLGVIGCSDAEIASNNLSKAADNFEINRRIVFYNGITDNYILSIEGRCSVEFAPEKFVVTCKTGPSEFKKHYLGRSDNSFPFIEQLDSIDVSTFHYRVFFKPEAILPDIDLKTSLEKE